MIREYLLMGARYWIAPKRVVRRMIDGNVPWYILLGIIILYGISYTLDQVAYQELGDYFGFGFLLLAAVGVGIGVGPLLWLIYSGLFFVLGKLFKGKGTWKDLQTAVAVSMFPFLFKLGLWILQLFLFREEMFMDFNPRINNSFFLLVFYLLMVLIDVISSIWYYILLFRAVGEAHGFSSWIGMLIVLFSVALVWVVVKYVFDTVLFPI
nr:YIP1 family protein [Polycladomyces sp. WAk]